LPRLVTVSLCHTSARVQQCPRIHG
jgi:hypothetical protein